MTSFSNMGVEQTEAEALRRRIERALAIAHPALRNAADPERSVYEQRAQAEFGLRRAIDILEGRA